jgi:hypothetical protein
MPGVAFGIGGLRPAPGRGISNFQCMPRLNAKQIRNAKIACAERAGLQCQSCGRKPPAIVLELDHIDNNAGNNPIDGSNHQLLCRSCNRKKSPRGKGRPRGDKQKSRGDSRGDYRRDTGKLGNWMRILTQKIKSLKKGGRMSSQGKTQSQANEPHTDLDIARSEGLLRYPGIARNAAAEPAVRDFIRDVLRKVPMIEQRQLVNACAEQVTQAGGTIGQEAVMRYLAKLTNIINGPYELWQGPDETWYVKRKGFNPTAQRAKEKEPEGGVDER